MLYVLKVPNPNPRHPLLRNMACAWDLGLFLSVQVNGPPVLLVIWQFLLLAWISLPFLKKLMCTYGAGEEHYRCIFAAVVFLISSISKTSPQIHFFKKKSAGPLPFCWPDPRRHFLGIKVCICGGRALVNLRRMIELRSKGHKFPSFSGLHVFSLWCPV